MVGSRGELERDIALASYALLPVDKAFDLTAVVVEADANSRVVLVVHWSNATPRSRPASECMRTERHESSTPRSRGRCQVGSRPLVI